MRNMIATLAFLPFLCQAGYSGQKEGENSAMAQLKAGAPAVVSPVQAVAGSPVSAPGQTGMDLSLAIEMYDEAYFCATAENELSQLMGQARAQWVDCRVAKSRGLFSKGLIGLRIKTEYERCTDEYFRVITVSLAGSQHTQPYFDRKVAAYSHIIRQMGLKLFALPSYDMLSNAGNYTMFIGVPRCAEVSIK